MTTKFRVSPVMTTSISLHIKFLKAFDSKIRLISMSAWLQATGYDHFDTLPNIVPTEVSHNSITILLYSVNLINKISKNYFNLQASLV